jgi:hypothetical protein
VQGNWSSGGPKGGILRRHADGLASWSLALQGAAVLGYLGYVLLGSRWDHEPCGSLASQVPIGLAQAGSWLLIAGFLVGVAALFGRTRLKGRAIAGVALPLITFPLALPALVAGYGCY